MSENSQLGYGTRIHLIYGVEYQNAIVRDFNAKLESFPDLLVAQKFNFKPRDYFELDEEEVISAKKMPRLDL